MNGKLQNRSAIVTGAGRGIGAAIAIAYAAAGANLTIASRTPPELDQVARQCRDSGASCVPVVADVSSQNDVQRLVNTALERFGQIDILANIAGVYGPIGPIEDVDLSSWKSALHINLLGTLYLCQAVLPSMRKQRYGRIIAMSGGGATAPLPRFSAYAASKAAVVRFVETLAEEVKDDGITVNAIAPGAIDTSLQDAVLAAGEPGELRERTGRRHSIGGHLGLGDARHPLRQDGDAVYRAGDRAGGVGTD